jgi:ectoine hydroxylase-related dioxygenase (phytanoyl-CoA dioxygenase family)
MITDAELEAYEQNGYHVARGLFSREEAERLREHFTGLRLAGTYPGDVVGVNAAEDDPARKYAVMHHPHRWDDAARAHMLDARIRDCLTQLIGDEPLACQSMVYFKPPQSRGQALHQDQYYLRVSPGTCIAAWMALDDVDVENGCLHIVPGTHKLDLLCTVEADTATSITNVTVPLPEEMKAEPVEMRAGDVLFFNGQVVHGSPPNVTEDRFRRAITCHYVHGAVEKVTKYDQPVLRFDGSVVEVGSSDRGGQCGVWVSDEDQSYLEMREEAVDEKVMEYINKRQKEMVAAAEAIRQARAEAV